VIVGEGERSVVEKDVVVRTAANPVSQDVWAPMRSPSGWMCAASPYGPVVPSSRVPPALFGIEDFAADVAVLLVAPESTIESAPTGFELTIPACVGRYTPASDSSFRSAKQRPTG